MRYFHLFFYLWTASLAIGQNKIVYVIDNETQVPIEGAHLWISETEIGSFSDERGIVTLPIIGENLEVICSHLGYDYFRTNYNNLRDTIFLNPIATNLSEIELIAKATPKQKRYFRQFKAALLGKTKNAKYTSILNPEALVYKVKNGTMTVEAKDVLKIDNSLTGYTLGVLLESFSMKEEEITYSIKPHFTSYEIVTKDQQKARKQTFEGSYAHFIRHFINNTHRKAGYIVNVVAQNNDGSLRVVGPAKSSALINAIKDGLVLKSSALIQVAYAHEKDLVSDQETLKGGLSALGQSAEADMMGQEKNSIKLGSDAQVSYIFLPSSKAVLDKNGLPIKANSLVFLGYWNFEGVADLLPRNIEVINQ